MSSSKIAAYVAKLAGYRAYILDTAFIVTETTTDAVVDFIVPSTALEAVTKKLYDVRAFKVLAGIVCKRLLLEKLYSVQVDPSAVLSHTHSMVTPANEP